MSNTYITWLWVQVIYTFKLKIQDAHLDGTNVFGCFCRSQPNRKISEAPKRYSEISYLMTLELNLEIEMRF